MSICSNRALERHIDRSIDDYAQRPLLVVLTDIGERLGEVGIDHAGHGDQEVMGEVHELICSKDGAIVDGAGRFNKLRCYNKLMLSPWTRLRAARRTSRMHVARFDLLTSRLTATPRAPKNQLGQPPLATEKELATFLAEVERRAFKQAVFAVRDEHLAARPGAGRDAQAGGEVRGKAVGGASACCFSGFFKTPYGTTIDGKRCGRCGPPCCHRWGKAGRGRPRSAGYSGGNRRRRVLSPVPRRSWSASR